MDNNFKVWYVDLRASIHCTPYRDCFSDYVHGNYGHVTLGNRYRCSTNHTSVSGLDGEGYFVAFGEKQWKVIRGSMVVARGEKVKTLYTLSGTHNYSISLAFTKNQRITLWHQRLGHLSESGMRILHSKNALPGMKNIQLDFYEGCEGVSFRRDGKEKKIERLELAHTDVCGPTTVFRLILIKGFGPKA
ncbi:hypothetical protein RJ639_035257, partial [Escallonia herrerae]